MPSDASRADATGLRARLLAARDARQALLDRHLAGGHAAVVSVALNAPGPAKDPPGGAALLRWALAELAVALGGHPPRVLHQGEDALGPFALLAVALPPAAVKEACLALEGAHPAARLLDLDVHPPDGRPIGRDDLGLPPRPCLLCEAPARE
jgi:holo-ACP synthase CitX